MLSQLVYVSNRKANCTASEIDKILRACEQNNPNYDITGVLLYSDKKFIQYLEGESQEILGLYDKIKMDDRHQNAVMVSYGSIKEKLFPSWHMGTKEFDQDMLEFRTDINPEDKEIFKSILTGKDQNDSRVVGVLRKFFE